MKWFRFYSEAVNDPKVQRLPGDLFKFWVNLLCLANNADERGRLPKSADDIAWALRLDPDVCKSNLHTLQGQGLLDWCEDETHYCPHNWDERQKASDDSTARVQKHREKSNVTEPPIYKEDETLQKRYSNALDKNRLREEENREEESVARASDAPPPTPIKQKPPTKTLAAHPLPADFAITDTMRQWAKGKHVAEFIDLDKHTERFVAYWTEGEGQGRPKKNWLLTWQNWMTDEAEKAEARGSRIGGSNGTQGQVSTNQQGPKSFEFPKIARPPRKVG